MNNYTKLKFFNIYKENELIKELAFEYNPDIENDKKTIEQMNLHKETINSLIIQCKKEILAYNKLPCDNIDDINKFTYEGYAIEEKT